MVSAEASNVHRMKAEKTQALVTIFYFIAAQRLNNIVPTTSSQLLRCSPIWPGSSLPRKRMQTVTLKQLRFWGPSWHWGTEMLMETGKKMETSTVITGRVLQPHQHRKERRGINTAPGLVEKTDTDRLMRLLTSAAPHCPPWKPQWWHLQQKHNVHKVKQEL